MSRMDRYTCEQVFQRLDDYLDRELTPEEMRIVREHLETCAACAAEYRFQEELLNSVRERVQRISASPSLRDKVANALRKAQFGLE